MVRSGLVGSMLVTNWRIMSRRSEYHGGSSNILFGDLWCGTDHGSMLTSPSAGKCDLRRVVLAFWSDTFEAIRS